jgi:hypothetical protein
MSDPILVSLDSAVTCPHCERTISLREQERIADEARTDTSQSQQIVRLTYAISSSRSWPPLCPLLG